jgi:hypothetical protein
MRLPRFIIPAFVALALFGGYFLRSAFTQPTTNVAFNAEKGTQATFIVDGLKCKGTAAFFTSLYDSVPGIIGIETFATEYEAIITYDPDMITRDSIKSVMEKDVIFEDGTKSQIFKCISVE